MAKTYNRMRIDVNTKPADIITEVQADSNSRYLDVFLYDGGVPIDLTGHEVRIYMRKPENSGEIWNNGEITEPTNGRCQFLLTTQALEKTGYLKAQISIWKNNEEILSTQIFDISVTENLRTEGSIESSNEYGALVVLFQNLYEAYDLMTEMVQNIGTPDGVAAQYDLSTMWQAWEFLVAYMKGDLTTLIRDALANAAVQGVLDRIGTTADTGGSTTAGTVMGKENAVLNKLGNLTQNVANGAYQIYGDSKESVTLNQNLVLLDIQGKGKLFWVYFYGTISTETTSGLTSANTYIDFKVTIDDKVNFYLRYYTSSNKSSFSTYFLLADLKNMVKTTHGGNTTSTTIRTPDFLGSVSTGQSLRIVQPNQEMQKIDIYKNTSGNYAEICQILDYIKFEKSIKVEALLHSTASMSTHYPRYTYSVGCILDE